MPSNETDPILYYSRILFVELDTAFALDISSRLSRLGFLVNSVSSVHDARLLLNISAPELLLLAFQSNSSAADFAFARSVRADFHFPVLFLVSNELLPAFLIANSNAQFPFLLPQFSDPEFLALIHNALTYFPIPVAVSPLSDSELQLRDSDLRTNLLLDSLPVGVLQTTVKNGEIIAEFANKMFEHLTGFTADEFRSNTISDSRVHPDDIMEVFDNWTHWINSPDQTTLNQSYRFKHKSGIYKSFDVYLIKVADTVNNQRHIIQVALDVTEQKLLLDKSIHLASFPELNPHPVVEITTEGNVVYMNRVAHKLFPDLKSQGFKYDALKDLFQMLDAMKATNEDHIQTEITINDSVYELLSYFMPESHVFRFYFYDVTARKKAELELVKALNMERELNDLKSHFVETVSHEFRTPLTIILSTADILERYSDRISDDKKLDYLVKIKNSVFDLTKLLDNLLVQSSALSLADTFETVNLDIAAFCKDILVDFRSLLENNSNIIVFNSAANLPAIKADTRLLTYIMKNLLSNAVNFSSEGSDIVLDVFNDDKNIIIQVKNNGIGIPQDDISNLFTQYYRAANVGTIKGTGLGLSTVKNFVEMLGGTISLTSELNKETVVSVFLPIVSKF